MLRGYIKKTKPALWCANKKPEVKAPKRVRAVSKPLASSRRIYRERVKGWLLGKRCAVCKDIQATENHHKFGRRGRLLLWEPGWVPLCSAHHHWVTNHPIQSRALNLVGPEGTWNDFKRAFAHEESIRLKKLETALKDYFAHHETKP